MNFLSVWSEASKLFKVFLVCLGLQLVAAEAQEGAEVSEPAQTYSLPELLERASQNKDLQRFAEAAGRQADAKLRQVNAERWLSTLELQAFTGVVPDVNADSAVNSRDPQALLFDLNSGELDNDFSFSRLGPFGRVELKAIQPLITWGKVSSFADMADGNVELVEAQNRAQFQEARFMTKRAYYTLLLSMESKEILTEVRSRLATAEEKLEELLIKNSDNVEENDRLKIRVFIADVENRSLDAFRGERLARSALYELTGVEGDWVPSKKNLEPEVVQDLGKEDVIQKALRSQPEIQQLDRLIGIRQAEKGTVKADLFPTIFLAGQVDYAVAPGRTDVKNPYLSDSFNRFDLGVALGLKQDLGIHRTLNKMEQLQAEVEKLSAQKARLSSLVKIRTEEAFEKAASSMQAIQVNERGFRAARSWLTSTGLAFNLGTASTKDVLESYAAYFKARVDLMRAIFELNIALAELSKASGGEVVGELKSAP